MTHHQDKTLARAAAQMAFAAGSLLALLCSIVLATGVSQQTFERFMPPASYASALLEQASALRLIVAIDDVFVVTYVAATLLLCASLAGRASRVLLQVVLTAALLGGVLDLIENHHILAMLRAAEFGAEPSVGQIEAQVAASSLKWMLGHAAFALLAFALELPAKLAAAVRASLLGFQLPLGAATLVVTQEGWLSLLSWARYGSLLSGFFAISWLMGGASRPPSAYDAVGSSAPA
ncbi:MAG: hypothetical protein QM778_24220 [Myxococcales bacterium]